MSDALIPRLLDKPGAAVYLGVSEDVIDRLISSGSIAVVRLPASRSNRGDGAVRRTLLDRLDLDDLIPKWKEKRA